MVNSQTLTLKENLYLTRYAYQVSYFNLAGLFSADMLVVIPCYNEQGLIKTLNSLNDAVCPACCTVGVMVIINHSETAAHKIKKQNQSTLEEFHRWVEVADTKGIVYQAIVAQLPKKHAGVGLARKVGMDDAVRVFDQNGKDGVIICLDADCTVELDYFEAIWNTFKYSKVNSASIFFEHDISFNPKTENTEGILLYELYLRYYIDALKYADYPMAVQTIGSSMAVRSSAYQKSGGMNKRKAGEDFYFIHKLLPLSGYVEINDTVVRPSGRVSDRVPFGTGAAIGKWTNDPSTLENLYNPLIFEDLKVFLDECEHLFTQTNINFIIQDLPNSIREFLTQENDINHIERIRHKTSSLLSFKKQLWHYFDGLKALKYVHYATEYHHPKVSVREGLNWLFCKHIQRTQPSDLTTALRELRVFDRTSVKLS